MNKCRKIKISKGKKTSLFDLFIQFIEDNQSDASQISPEDFFLFVGELVPPETPIQGQFVLNLELVKEEKAKATWGKEKPMATWGMGIGGLRDVAGVAKGTNEPAKQTTNSTTTTTTLYMHFLVHSEPIFALMHDIQVF
jgi:hypothetical protein